jgi:sortase (surface protein transpeptidase)
MKKILRSPKLHLCIGVVLILIGLALFWLRTSNSLVHTQPVAPVTANVWSAKPDTISGTPVELQLPSLGLDLQVINGAYNPTTKTWTLTSDKVQYAVITPPPNNTSGDTFIYGHYRSGVLATLHTIKPGAQAVVVTANGHTFTYTFTGSRVTDPSDTSVFSYQGAPILTIQTCTGLFFQNRQLFTFSLSGVK